MVHEVDSAHVKEQIDNEEDVQIVDIRDPRDYEEGHIPGAINIPMAELPRRVAEYDWGDEVVVVCPIGQSSIQAANLLESYENVDEDADVASMEGGYDGWEYELESGREPEDITS